TFGRPLTRLRGVAGSLARENAGRNPRRGAATASALLSRVGLGGCVTVLAAAGALARENAVRNPRRTAATASALMIGVGLVAFVTVFAASVREAVAASVDTQLTADFAVNGTGFRGVVTADIAERVAQTPGVAVSSGLTV